MNSDSATTASCIDALLAERAWLQRMAGALVRDGDAAQDLAQETWVTALTSPPRSVTRTWLHRVFRSRLCDDSRARHRRQLREQALFETAAEGIATPEEITARMQLFRRVAEHMLALDEDVRQVLYLRYVEDLEPVEVARRLGIPGGTVRWRLKRGLDELRARLDADGDRRRWVPLLAPLAVTRPPPSRPRSGPAPTLFLAPMAGLLAVGLSLATWRCARWSPGTPDEPSAVMPNAEKQVLRAAATLDDRDASPAANQPGLPCPVADALERERDALAGLPEQVRVSAKEMFQKAAPHAVIDRQFAADVNELFEKVGKCEHTFECRGRVCRVSLMIPEAITKVQGWTPFECFDADVWDRVHPHFSGLPFYDYGGVTFDPVSKTGFTRFDAYYRLFNDRAAPATAEEKRPIQLPPGWDRDRGPLPAGLAPVCRARVVRLRTELATLARQITRNMDVNLAFEQGTPQPERARELAVVLGRHLAAPGKPLPVDIDCRGRICALLPRADVAGSTVHWQCMHNGKPGGSSCLGAWNDDGWLWRLQQNFARLPLENLVPQRQHEGVTTPAFAVLREPVEKRGVPLIWWIREIFRTLDVSGVVAACEQRHPTRGALTVLARLRETCGITENTAEPLLTVQYGGELMNSPLADCLRVALDQALARIEPPGCSYAGIGEWTFMFPHPKIDLPPPDEN